MTDTPDLQTMTGLEMLRWTRDHEDSDSVPRVQRLLGITLDVLEEGRVEVVMETRPEFANLRGVLHGGIAAAVMDTALGWAITSVAGPGVGVATLELKVNYIRSVDLDGQLLRGIGTVIHGGRTTATAEGRILDDQGRLVAHATTTCLMLQPKA